MSEVPKMGALVVSVHARVYLASTNCTEWEYSDVFPRGLVVSVDSASKTCTVVWPAQFTNVHSFSDVDVLVQGFES